MGVSIAILAMVIAIPMLHRTLSGTADAYAAERPRTSPCAGWDDAASDAITQFVQSDHDVDLRLLGDALFRMRHARRNCQLGWVRLACVDYHAIIRGSPGLRDTWLPSAFECSSPDGESIDSTTSYFPAQNSRF